MTWPWRCLREEAFLSIIHPVNLRTREMAKAVRGAGFLRDQAEQNLWTNPSVAYKVVILIRLFVI